MTSTYTISAKDVSDYEQGYNIFLSRSDFRERIIEKFADLSMLIQTEEILKILDIGCGNGEMTSRYLSESKLARNKIHLTLVEPAEDSLKTAIELLKDKVLKLDFHHELKSEQNFNVILASYVFYHLPAKTLHTLTSQLKTQGALFIMMGTTEHPLKSHPKLKAESNHGSSDKLTPFLNQLSSNDYVVDRFKVKTTTKLSGLWENGIFSKEGKVYLTFSLNKQFTDLSKDAFQGLEEIFSEAFKHENPAINSFHEIIRIKRIK